jgi:hypothetical protein
MNAARYWRPLQESPLANCCQITVANLDMHRAHVSQSNTERICFVQGDARRMELPDNSFDLVHSNSMLEHVGGWRDMLAAASEIRRLAPRYYVQTPNFGFPFEVHYRLPFVHWMPEQLRARIVLMRRNGFLTKAATFSEAMEIVQGSQLLNSRQMNALFPDASVVPETVMGFLTKSLIAIRR